MDCENLNAQKIVTKWGVAATHFGAPCGLGRSATRSATRSVARSAARSVARSAARSVARSVARSAARPLGCARDVPADQASPEAGCARAPWRSAGDLSACDDLPSPVVSCVCCTYTSERLYISPATCTPSPPPSGPCTFDLTSRMVPNSSRIVGAENLDPARPYGSNEHPCLKLQTIIDAYVQVRGETSLQTDSRSPVRITHSRLTSPRRVSSGLVVRRKSMPRLMSR